MKTTVSDLREDYRNLQGDRVYDDCPPTRWRAYAEWLERKIIKQFDNSLENYPSEADRKRKAKELVLFATKIHYAQKLLLNHTVSDERKKRILRRLDQTNTITQLRKEYKQIVSELEPPVNIKEQTENVEVPDIEILKKQYPSICYSCVNARKPASDINIARGYVGCSLNVMPSGMYRDGEPKCYDFTQVVTAEEVGEGWVDLKSQIGMKPSGVITNFQIVTKGVRVCHQFELITPKK